MDLKRRNEFLWFYASLSEADQERFRVDAARERALEGGMTMNDAYYAVMVRWREEAERAAERQRGEEYGEVMRGVEAYEELKKGLA